MRNALRIVAFNEGDKLLGIVSLLETALEAIYEEGYNLAAIHVDMALVTLAIKMDLSPDQMLDLYMRDKSNVVLN